MLAGQYLQDKKKNNKLLFIFVFRLLQVLSRKLVYLFR